MNTVERIALFHIASFALILPADAEGLDLHVSPGGSDRNPGTRARPLASLEGARDAIRRLGKAARAKGVTVRLAAGSYSLKRTFELDRRDSGTERAPIVYRAEDGAGVHVMGGRLLPNDSFKPVRDNTTLERLDAAAAGKVLRCNLKSLGVTDYGQTSARAMARGALLELFFNDEPLHMSRWPNSGWAKYGKVIDRGSRPRWKEKPDRPGTLVYTGTRPERWTRAKHIWLHGYFAFDWYDDVLKVATLDTRRKRMTFTTPHLYGLSPNKRYRAIGLLEEIDEPGEWMIDHGKGILYLYPPAAIAGARISISILEDPMIRMTETAHVSIRGLTLEVTRGTGIVIAGGADNLIAGCTVRNIGASGIVIRPARSSAGDAGGLHRFLRESVDPLENGRRNGVVGCDLYNIGATGIALFGGDRRTLAPGGHYAVNNDIHHYARRQRTNQPAINMNGVGHRAAHNFIHDAPHVGLFYSGNDHIIEYNEATRTCQETGDVGVFYSGRDWTYRGNVVRHNFIHHVKGPGKHGSNAVYLDDSHSSTHIYGNVFYKVQIAAFIGGGHDNVVENNIFVEAGHSVHIDNRSQGWAHKYQKRGGDHRMYAKLEAVNHDRPPYSVRYPRLARILDGDPHAPTGNRAFHNICVRSKWIHGPAKFLKVENNLIIRDDPGFRDIGKMDFTLRTNADVFKRLPGFKPIPFDRIGLRKDEFRRVISK